MYGLEVVLPIECEISSLKLIVKILLDTSINKKWLLYLTYLDEPRWNVELAIETKNKWLKAQYESL